MLIPGMGRVGWLIVVCVAVAMAVFAAGAMATGEEILTRDAYVERLEGMCKPGAEATQQVMVGVRQDVRYPKRL